MYTRNCPTCNKLLSYKNKQSVVSANKRGVECYQCAFSKRPTMTESEKVESRKRATKKFKLKLQKYIWDYLSTHPCVDCGETNILFLEFDHVDFKKEWVSFLVRKHASIKKIKNEIEKCQVRCIGCHRIRHKNKKTSSYMKHKLEYVINKSCIDCGETNPELLEFDHVRGIKRNNVSTLLLSKSSKKKIIEEIKKCDIVCCNCHRKRTAIRGNWNILKYINGEGLM